jgi:phosphatidylserine decarboxylase
MIFVGALNVGAISFNFEENIHNRRNAIEIINYDDKKISFKKGDEMGCFMMGSTIVMIAETDTFTINIKIGDNVRFGDNI